MAQSEDTELRDLVLEALEKNGSLAKIRALLRANVFLAFEDDYENIKQNAMLDNLLNFPEGKLSLSIVHEFLEFCNLKNTLFVYKAESRQKKDYYYEGAKNLTDKLHLPKRDSPREPILVTLVRNLLSQTLSDYANNHNLKPNDNKDDQNSTYIVHEDTSSVSTNSQSDNSSDEKNKLHLRLQLDNSDTDTSSDSTRDKSSSEYIPSQHLVTDSNIKILEKLPEHRNEIVKANEQIIRRTNGTQFLPESKLANSSSDSTSYFDVKSINKTDEKLMNITEMPITDSKIKRELKNEIQKPPMPELSMEFHTEDLNAAKVDSVNSPTLNSGLTISSKNKSSNTILNASKYLPEEAISDVDTLEYSLDFTSSDGTKNKDVDKPLSPESVREKEETKSPEKIALPESPHQNSLSWQSSISISDVTDLISDINLSLSRKLKNRNNLPENSSEIMGDQIKKASTSDKSKISDDSTEFSVSPIPSLSNLSLDINSD